MFSQSNDFAYMGQFNGNMPAHSEPVPVKVSTRLRVMPETAATQIRQHSSRAFDAPPQYVFGGGNLPLHPSLQAVGRHYFTW